MKKDESWYKNAIFYELHIRAFADGNGDGIGDFTGAAQKLDYLQEMGISGIWLLPFYASPLRDDGYVDGLIEGAQSPWPCEPRC